MSIPRQGTAVRGLAHYTIFVFYLYFYLPFSGELGVDSELDHRVAACVYNCHVEAGRDRMSDSFGIFLRVVTFRVTTGHILLQTLVRHHCRPHYTAVT